jgi:hypothetical protein
MPEKIQRILQVHPQFRPAPAILLAADSRWSYEVGKDFDDGGVKLTRVDSHVAAVYSGNTIAGETAFAQLTAAFRQARRAGTDGLVEPERILQHVWRKHAHQGGGLHLCLGGFFGATSEPIALRFDHEANFRATPVEAVASLGWPDACDFFLQRLEEEVSNEMSVPLSEKALALSAEHWWGLIARLVAEACEEKVHASVGGRILGAIVTREGAQGRSLYRIDTRADKPEAERLSLAPDEVESFYNRQKTRVPAIKPPRYYGPRSAR